MALFITVFRLFKDAQGLDLIICFYETSFEIIGYSHNVLRDRLCYCFKAGFRSAHGVPVQLQVFLHPTDRDSECISIQWCRCWKYGDKR